MRVLVVEDEPKMSRLLKRGLSEEGHPADVVPTGEEALRRASTGRYDAIVLDLALPGLDGFATCRELRSRGVWTPVLLLSAHDVVADRIAGLDIGADDCLVKPFSFAELLARLRALVRRAPGEWRTAPQVDNLRLDSTGTSSPTARCRQGGEAT